MTWDNPKMDDDLGYPYFRKPPFIEEKQKEMA
jgi:hypothetical protein